MWIPSYQTMVLSSSYGASQPVPPALFRQWRRLTQFRYCGLILTPLGLIAWPLPAAVVILKRIPPAALVIRNRTCRELLGFWVLIVFGVNSVGTMVAIKPYTIGLAVFLREGKTIPPAVIRWDERFALSVLFALILQCLTIAIMHPRSYEYLRARIGRLKVRRRWGPI